MAYPNDGKERVYPYSVVYATDGTQCEYCGEDFDIVSYYPDDSNVQHTRMVVPVNEEHGVFCSEGCSLLAQVDLESKIRAFDSMFTGRKLEYIPFGSDGRARKYYEAGIQIVRGYFMRKG
jgi:hypothetical protein